MPAERGIDYYNRKDYYSVVLQVVVREDMRFTDVYAGLPDRVHDARVFRQSHISVSCPALCGDDHILGDSAYPNLPFLLTPFKDNGHLTAGARFAHEDDDYKAILKLERRKVRFQSPQCPLHNTTEMLWH